MIDPIGLALENFDVSGAWRIRDNGMPVDAASAFYDGTTLEASFESAIAGQTFSLNKGTFAAAWNVDDFVVFTAYLDGNAIGSKIVVMNQTAQEIRFGHDFDHIDQVVITCDPGSDQNPSDGGAGPELAMENLKIEFDPLRVGSGVEHADLISPLHHPVAYHWDHFLLA